MSRFTITSRPHASRVGAEQAWSLEINGGAKAEPRPAAHPPGTRVEVRDLFYATPARLKFLKVDRTESEAIRDVVPPLLNDFISLQKDTALVAVLGPIEILRQAQIDASSSFNYTPYVTAAALFLLITVPLTRYTDRVLLRSIQRQNAQGTA